MIASKQACLALALSVAALPSEAAPIEGGEATYQFFNSFFVRFPSTSPFYPDVENLGNPDAPDIDVEISYFGTIREVWQDQQGSTIQFEVADIFGVGDLGGTPFEIRGGASAPELDSFDGEFTNVVQDETDPGFASGAPSSLQSADRRAGGPFAQVLNPGTDAELFLYGSTDYFFENSVDSLPYELGQELLGTADSLVPIRLMVGDAPNEDVDPVIGTALPNGFVEIVPEPSATSLAAAMLAGTAGQRRCRKRS